MWSRTPRHLSSKMQKPAIQIIHVCGEFILGSAASRNPLTAPYVPEDLGHSPLGAIISFFSDKPSFSPSVSPFSPCLASSYPVWVVYDKPTFWQLGHNRLKESIKGRFFSACLKLGQQSVLIHDTSVVRAERALTACHQANNHSMTSHKPPSPEILFFVSGGAGPDERLGESASPKALKNGPGGKRRKTTGNTSQSIWTPRTVSRLVGLRCGSLGGELVRWV